MFLHPLRHNIREAFLVIKRLSILQPTLRTQVLKRQQYPFLNELIIHEINGFWFLDFVSWSIEANS